MTNSVYNYSGAFVELDDTILGEQLARRHLSVPAGIRKDRLRCHGIEADLSSWS